MTTFIFGLLVIFCIRKVLGCKLYRWIERIYDKHSTTSCINKIGQFEKIFEFFDFPIFPGKWKNDRDTHFWSYIILDYKVPSLNFTLQINWRLFPCIFFRYEEFTLIYDFYLNRIIFAWLWRRNSIIIKLLKKFRFILKLLYWLCILVSFVKKIFCSLYFTI